VRNLLEKIENDDNLKKIYDNLKIDDFNDFLKCEINLIYSFYA
jgi:hypothetical protein